jgi:3'-phosphoadenosine 5'-phosphosulfate (PAPS) 3'-phosphatase
VSAASTNPHAPAPQHVLSRSNRACVCAHRWDHACGLICVEESGAAASATDANGNRVLFTGREFKVSGGIVCTSRWTPSEVRDKLLQAAQR